MFQELHGLKPIVLRASNPYGERQGHQGVQGVIGTFLHKAYNNEHIEIWGDGSVVRDFIYVGDLGKMCLKAVENEVCGVFNIGSGVGHSVNDVLACVKSVSNRPLHVDYKPARGFDVDKVVLDISRATSTFNWTPQLNLQDGISRTWAWLSESPKQ